MSEISIKRPISIEIDTIETDSYLPSFKVNIKLNIKHPTGSFSYQANDLWFECSTWDNFILDLNTFNHTPNFNIKLLDISEYFSLAFTKDKSDETVVFKININEPFSGENGEGYIGYQGKLDSDVMAIIKKDFDAFNKWW